MQTTAQEMEREFKEKFMKTMGPNLKEEGKKETAKRMLQRGYDIEKGEGGGRSLEGFCQ